MNTSMECNSPWWKIANTFNTFNKENTGLWEKWFTFTQKQRPGVCRLKKVSTGCVQTCRISCNNSQK